MHPSVVGAQSTEEEEDQVELWIWSVNCRLINFPALEGVNAKC
jgi:hypothetical protein